MPYERVVTYYYAEECVRCPWPTGSRWEGRGSQVEAEVRRAEDRHEYYCRQGLPAPAHGRTPNAALPPG